jgi:8-oxo-dGTP pyrophosphatase MutT (NUDIX family)
MIHRDDVAQLLAGFTPGPDEFEARSRMNDLLAIGDDPFARHTFDPGHFTASAVLREQATSRVLLIHHAKLGRWLQPGGHIEPRDLSIIDAARREALEEAGALELEPIGLLDLDVHRIPPFGNEPAHHHFDLRILFDVVGGDPVAGDGTLDLRWVDAAGLGSLESDDSVARLVRKASG